MDRRNWPLLCAAPWLGALLTLAFAPYAQAWLTLPALTGLYWLWSAGSPRSAMQTGYLFGLGYFGTGIWWTYISIHDYGGGSTVAACLLTLLLAGFWAMVPAATAYVAAGLMRPCGAGSRATIAAALWIAGEYCRGVWILNGFPWLQIGYSQLDTALAGYAPLTGVYGVGFLLALSAFWLGEMLTGKLKLRVALPILLTIWTGGALLKQYSWTHAAGAPIRITLVQGNIGQERKWLPAQQQATLSLYQQLTRQHWDSNVIIWPETAIPAFFSRVRETFLEPLASEARAHAVDLVVSLPSDDDEGRYFNSVLAIGKDYAFYHKNHLLPFGEYLPLQPLATRILRWVQIPMTDFSAGGDRQPLLSAGGRPFITTICYEDAFGELVARQAAAAAYIVNVSNDAWFGDSAEPYQHMQMARMRALETGRYLVRATNTGLSGFIAPDGSLRSQAPMFTEATLTDHVIPMTGETPYVRYGDRPVFAVLIGLAALSATVRRRRPDRR